MTIEFSTEEKAELVRLLTDYFRDELDQEIGRFEAEFLLDFITQKMGPAFYNKGVRDAHAVLSKQMEGIEDALYALEDTV